jgi:hypothetical protein
MKVETSVSISSFATMNFSRISSRSALMPRGDRWIPQERLSIRVSIRVESKWFKGTCKGMYVYIFVYTRVAVYVFIYALYAYQQSCGSISPPAGEASESAHRPLLYGSP